MSKELDKTYVFEGNDLATQLENLPRTFDPDDQAAKIVADVGIPVTDWTREGDAPGIRVTVDELAGALAATFAFYPVAHARGSARFGYVAQPEDAAESILRSIVVRRQDEALAEDVVDATIEDDEPSPAPGVTVGQLAGALESFHLQIRTRQGAVIPGEVAYPDEVARVLHATLSRMAALREDDGQCSHPPVTEPVCAVCLRPASEHTVTAPVTAEELSGACSCGHVHDDEPEPVSDDPEVMAISECVDALEALPVKGAAGRAARYLAQRYDRY